MTTATQLIDFEGNYLPTVGKWVRDQNVQERGFEYSVLTVLGCQSSGKSTLLNHLFGTSFEVMDATRGRNQTTKGLWLSRDADNASTFIIDVEGTDSRERGEDRLTFEHRAALFSLALADVVLVNMWYHDIGRYTASNYGLLKTVLAVNLELFQQEKDAPKTTMIFVIRDYSESETPIDSLKTMISDDVRNIWKEITKPKSLMDSTADDFFDFKTMGLPPKSANYDQFKLKCDELKNMFYKECRPAAYSRRIPADGFAYYSQSVWETILSSCELDIPSQKEMLATFRCEELKNSVLSEVFASLPEYLGQAQQGCLPTSNFSWGAALVEKALELYDGPASRYLTHVFEKKRIQLLQQIQFELQKIVDIHLMHVRHRIAAEASTGLELLFSKTSGSDMLGGVPKIECWAKFSETCPRWEIDAMKRFDAVTSNFSLTYSSLDNNNDVCNVLELDVNQARTALQEALIALVTRMREKQRIEFDKMMGGVAAEQLGDLDIFLSAPDLTSKIFWGAIIELVKTTKTVLDEQLLESFMGLQLSAEAHAEVWDRHVLEEIAEQLRTKLLKVCEWLQNHIVARFLQFFEQDDQGVPRQWQNLTSDKIKEYYVAARDKALIIITILDDGKIIAASDIPELNKLIEPPLLTDSRRLIVLSRANRQMQQKCQEVQIIQATGGRGMNVPWWMWVLMFALGYNEMAMILFSPVSLILLLVVTAVGLVTYYTGQMRLPMDLSRQLMSVFATAVIPMLSAIQQGPASAASSLPIGKPRDLKEESVKKE